MEYASLFRRYALPTAEEREIAGGAQYDENNLPYFPDLDIETISTKEEKLYCDRNRLGRRKKIGWVVTKQFVTNDGIDRRSRLWLPDDRVGNVMMQSGTAFTTSIDGYAGERAKLIAKRVHVPSLQHDCEFSSKQGIALSDLLKLKSTIAAGLQLSLAKSAASEMLMTHEWVNSNLYNLPDTISVKGDSYDANTVLALPHYASRYKLKVPYIDAKAPVLLDPIESNMKGVERLAKWLKIETLGGAAVIGALLAEGDLSVFRGTIPPNMRFWVGSMTGIAPMLLGGGVRQFVETLPHGLMGYVNLYKKDLLCDVDAWQQSLAPHERIAVNMVSTGIHANLLSRINQSKQRGRDYRFVEQNIIHGDDFAAYDERYIYGASSQHTAMQAA